MPEQVGQKHHGFLLAYSFVENLEIETPERHTGRHRDGFPVEVILQDRRLTTGCPRPATVWALAQSAFVDEDNRTPFFLGFFLIAGQVFRCHSRMASSLRSNARPAGRCGLQFSCRNSFQTCPA